MVDLAVSLLTDIAAAAVPVAVVFELGNIIIGTMLRVAFGGRLWFGR